jgi:hypothetical protein
MPVLPRWRHEIGQPFQEVQPLMAFHATVRTAREKSGFKAGLRQREKPGLERGQEAPRHLEASVASGPASIVSEALLIRRPCRRFRPLA